ncbi:hypothetical protein RvY_18669 [Ramazzottius varieornatus]|uniref:Uncharacterized protein n=1 Tax=Ramazzottius varieornatus TaxID=947166 RepID=A0A1D1W6Q5_RAMVA|nr:hypothetical protein RvY_18669 [Ramazzottius varieornatus]
MEQSSDTDSCSDVFDRLREAESEILELSRNFAERQHFGPSYPLISQTIMRQSSWPTTTPEPPPASVQPVHKEEHLSAPEPTPSALPAPVRRTVNVKPSASSSGTLTAHTDKLIPSLTEASKRASKIVKVYPSKSADWVEKPLEAALRQKEEVEQAKATPHGPHSMRNKPSPPKSGMKLITGSPPIIVLDKPSSSLHNNSGANSPRSGNKLLHSVHEDARRPFYGENRDSQPLRREGPPGDPYRKSVFYPKDDFKAKNWDGQSTSTADTKTDQQQYCYNEEPENPGRFPSRRFRKGKAAQALNEMPPNNQTSTLNNSRGSNQQNNDKRFVDNKSNNSTSQRPFSGNLNNANFPNLDGSSLGTRRNSQSSISESFASSSRPDTACSQQTASSRCSASVSQHSFVGGRPNSGPRGHHPKVGPSYQPNNYPSSQYRPPAAPRATGPHGIYSKPWSHQYGESTSTGSRVFSQSKNASFNKAVGPEPTGKFNSGKSSMPPRFNNPHHGGAYQSPSSPNGYYEPPMTSTHSFYDTPNMPPVQIEATQNGMKMTKDGIVEGGDVNVKRHCRTGSTTSQSGKPCTCHHNKGAAVTSPPVTGPASAPPWNAMMGNFYQPPTMHGTPSHPMYVYGNPQPDFLQDLTTPEGKIRRARLLDKRLNDMLRAQFGFRREVMGQTAWMTPAGAMQNNFGLVVGQEF